MRSSCSLFFQRIIRAPVVISSVIPACVSRMLSGATGLNTALVVRTSNNVSGIHHNTSVNTGIAPMADLSSALLVRYKPL